MCFLTPLLCLKLLWPPLRAGSEGVGSLYVAREVGHCLFYDKFAFVYESLTHLLNRLGLGWQRKWSVTVKSLGYKHSFVFQLTCNCVYSIYFMDVGGIY